MKFAQVLMSICLASAAANAAPTVHCASEGPTQLDFSVTLTGGANVSPQAKVSHFGKYLGTFKRSRALEPSGGEGFPQLDYSNMSIVTQRESLVTDRTGRVGVVKLDLFTTVDSSDALFGSHTFGKARFGSDFFAKDENTIAENMIVYRDVNVVCSIENKKIANATEAPAQRSFNILRDLSASEVDYCAGRVQWVLLKAQGAHGIIKIDGQTFDIFSFKYNPGETSRLDGGYVFTARSIDGAQIVKCDASAGRGCFRITNSAGVILNDYISRTFTCENRSGWGG